MEGSVDFKGEDILAADLKAQSVLTGPDFKVVRPLAFARKAVLRGDHRMVRLRPGLSVHTSDTTTLQDLTTAIEQPAGLTVMVFLEGDVDASIGGVPLEVGRKQDGPVRGVMVSRARADRFVRRARKGERMRKVVVTCSPEWVADCGFDGSLERNVVAEFCATHLARFEWVASPAFVAIAEQMLHSPRSPCYPEHLYLESRALDLLGEAFSALGERGGSHAHPTLSPSDQRRLQLVEDTIAASAGEAPTAKSRVTAPALPTAAAAWRDVHLLPSVNAMAARRTRVGARSTAARSFSVVASVDIARNSFRPSRRPRACAAPTVRGADGAFGAGGGSSFGSGVSSSS